MQSKQLYIGMEVLLEGGLEKVQREKVIIVKLRSVFLKNPCSSTNPRKNLNKNFSFLVIFLYRNCYHCHFSFSNYESVATRH